MDEVFEENEAVALEIQRLNDATAHTIQRQQQLERQEAQLIVDVIGFPKSAQAFDRTY